MATMKTLNGYGFNATELNGKNSDSYLQLGDDEAGSTGEAPVVNAGTFGGMTVAQFVDMIYPVGSIYMSLNSTSPAALFGGTWEQIKDRFLLAAGSTYAAGSTGGEATHTLTVSEMPSHNHSVYGGLEVTSVNTNSLAMSGEKVTSYRLTGAEGGSEAHNNMPPYLAVYMWQRTA